MTVSDESSGKPVSDRLPSSTQSVKSAEKGGRALIRTGNDAGKKIKGKKAAHSVRHIRFSAPAIVHPATFKIAMEAFLVMATLFGMFPF